MGTAQAQAVRPAHATRRPTAAVGLGLVAFLGLTTVGLAMSFVYDAPGEIGSPIEDTFHAIGVVELLLGLGVLVCAIFLVIGGYDVELWGTAMLGLGLIAALSLLIVAAEGTFAVVFLCVPGLLAALGGFLARRFNRWAEP